MTEAVVLLLVAVVVGAGGPFLLERLSWTDAHPRLGVATWLATLWTASSALLLGLSLLAVDNAFLRDTVADLVHACIVAFHSHYGSNPAASLGAFAALLLLAGALVAKIVSTRARMWSARRRHHEALDLLGRDDIRTGVTVIDHPVPTAYCVAGRGGRVVVSSGAIATLDEDRLRAVIGHERAHLTGRHHLVVAVVETCTTVFPFLPVARRAPVVVRHLLERLADETACRASSPEHLAGALRALRPGARPASALGAVPENGFATEWSVDRRVAELQSPAPALTAKARMATCVALVTATMLPFALAANQVLAFASASHCPLPPV